jgi:hypothetical protein
MTWTSLAREELDRMISRGLEMTDDAVQAAWLAMRITPERWRCSPWGDQLGGFWVVAEKDGCVVWYNEIEGGFNTSRFSNRGTIDEYFCNQTTFYDFLLSLPEARQAENWSDDISTGGVPSELENGGAIVRRQTTYWTLLANDGSSWRLHFKSKAEERYAQAHFSSIKLVNAHPMLDKYAEPWEELYFTGVFACPTEFISAIREAVLTASEGWRTFDEYRISTDLTRGYGLLMRAPASLVRLATGAITALGVKTSILKCIAPTATLSAAIMDRNVIVADKFRFAAYSDLP